MPIAYSHGAGAGVVRTTVSGGVDARFALAAAELIPVRARWQGDLAKGLRGMLIHAPSEHAFGVCRMIDAESADAEVRFEVVRDGAALAQRLEALRGRRSLESTSPGALHG
ncbi:MAG: hypothetical protein V2I63_09675 [Pseudomonadales bacterium]|nr:hypothetical protein [Pseudomonadales bacterium]